MANNTRIRRLIEKGILVCPVTKEKLHIVEGGTVLVSHPSGLRYQMLRGRVPVLLTDEVERNYEEYVRANDEMCREYTEDAVAKHTSFYGVAYQTLTPDYRTTSAKEALQAIFETVDKERVLVDVGGGPARIHPELINLNIGPFPNVDVVADAHILPFTSETVDGIRCEAVLEHLYDPSQAVAEMYRVLKPGGKVYTSTPFMQAYHGYPYHYQNFTLTGHQRLFESHGFRVEDSGTAVGPVYALMNLNGAFLYKFLPKPINLILGKAWGLLARFVRPLDLVLNKRPNSHMLASTTYLLACKP